jgi:predicted ester cyclase
VSNPNKAVIRRLVDEVMNECNLGVVDELYVPAIAADTKRWIAPFQQSFPDMHMEIVEMIAEGDRVAARFTCSGTHTGEWLGHAPTGRRFELIDEVTFFRFEGGRIAGSWTLEDTLTRLQQLGLQP